MVETPTPEKSAPRPWVRPDFDQIDTAPEVTDYAGVLL